MEQERLKHFFAFARHRHEIHIRKSLGDAPPWTEDKILATYKFTNIYRELDKTTLWFRENIREPLRNDRSVMMATIAFRWFNLIESAEILHAENSLFLNWNAEEALRRLEGRAPVVTGAYIIKTPNGMNKLQGVVQCIQNCHEKSGWLYREMCSNNLRGAHRILCTMPYMGPFMAYEVITDLRHTHILEKAPDIMHWANPGPGCRRGLSRLLGEDVNHLANKSMDLILPAMREILSTSRDPNYWPLKFRPWEMREVEHTLCEFDKYERARLGEGTPKQRYRYDRL